MGKGNYVFKLKKVWAYLAALVMIVAGLGISASVAQASPPTNLRAISITNTSVRLAWNYVSNATIYKVYKNNVYYADSSNNEETVSGLTAGTTYSFKVAATVSGVQYFSAPISVKTTGGTVTPPPTTPPSTSTEAAKVFNWGAVLNGDEFNYTGKPDSTKWGMYNGPGHGGKGLRSPDAWSVANGMVTVTGDSAGKTGGMASKWGSALYTRVETRMRVDANTDPQYHPVLILWPSQGWTNGTCWEIDYAEGVGPLTSINFFNHTGCPGQTSARKTIDITQWHNYAVEWSANKVVGYIDGVKWFEDTNPSHSMNVKAFQTIQLDWFPKSGVTPRTSKMYVDWTRTYKAP